MELTHRNLGILYEIAVVCHWRHVDGFMTGGLQHRYSVTCGDIHGFTKDRHLTESWQTWEPHSVVAEDSSLLGCDGVSEFPDVSVDRTAFDFIDQALNTHKKSSQTV